MRRATYLTVAAILVLGLLAAVAAGCGSQETTTTSGETTTTVATGPSTTIFAPIELPPPTSDPVLGGVVKVAILSTPARFGFPPSVIGPDQWFEGLFLETLFNPTIRVDEYVPALAESWELTPDKSAYIFHLRQGVKFTDGTDFNAEACKFCWDLNIGDTAAAPGGAPPAGGPPPGGGDAAGGPPPGPPGPPPDFAFVDSIQVVDTYTVQVNLKYWSNQVLPFIGRKSWAVFSPTAFEKMGADGLATNPVGTGPWMLKSFIPDQSMVLEKNPNYWGKDAAGRQLPYMDGVELQVFVDPTTELMALKAGDVDAAAQVGTVAASQLQGDAAYTLAGFRGPVQMIEMNTTDPASVWTDPNMRQALEYAIDKEGIARSVGLGFTPPVYEIIHSVGMVLDPGTTPRTYDPKKAADLISAAGHTGLEVTLSYDSTMGDPSQAAALKANLDAVGLKVTLNGMPSPAFSPLSTKVPPPNELFMNGERGGAPNVLQGAIEMFSRGTLYFPGFAPPEEFYTLMNSAQQYEKLADAAADIARMEQIAYDGAYVIPVTMANFVAVSGPRLKNMNWYYGNSPTPWFVEAWLGN